MDRKTDRQIERLDTLACLNEFACPKLDRQIDRQIKRQIDRKID